ncbi:hypothetical protein AB3S75_021932 [Citrus x aurantiifolia]
MGTNKQVLPDVIEKHPLVVYFVHSHCTLIMILPCSWSACKDKYLVFELEDNYLAVLEREAAVAASSCILKDYGIPSERSSDLLEPYVDPLGENQAINQDSGDSPVSDLEIGFDGLKWA